MRVELPVVVEKDQFIRRVIQKNKDQRELYTSIVEDVLQEISLMQKPQGYYLIDDARVNCLISLGSEIGKLVDQYQQKGDYLHSYILDLAGCDLLFLATKALRDIVLKDNDLAHFGDFILQEITPDSPETLPVQKEILDLMNRHYNTHITITEGFMLNPVKSLAFYYEIHQGCGTEESNHSCLACSDTQCPHREVEVVVSKRECEDRLFGRVGENLLEFLRANGCSITSPCSGNGTCGKCKVRISLKGDHSAPVSSVEAKLLSPQEIQEGIRLACYQTLCYGLTVECIEQGEMSILSTFDEGLLPEISQETNAFGVAIDIGTTTVVVALIDCDTGAIVRSERCTNPQVTFGSDVISRVRYANNEGVDTLRKVLLSHIQKAIVSVVKDTPIGTIVVSCNTTMAHSLRANSLTHLGEAPYMIPKNLELLDVQLYKDTPVYFFPWVSSFVGGDIVSGAYFSQIYRNSKPQLLVDIGTNGEVLLQTGDTLVATSTAAGPAFEGANITCGCGSIPGAISQVSMDGDKIVYHTIGDTDPIGICGTGLVDVVLLLVQKGIIDSTGYMKEPVDITPNVRIYPKDIRELQLAKSAICAGIYTLAEEQGLSLSDIETCYISGGFGTHVSSDHLIELGVLPKELYGKTTVLGNSSLGGAVKLLMEKDFSCIDTIQKQIDTVDLSNNIHFQNRYIGEMHF